MSQTESIRANFKQCIGKLNQIDTRAQAIKQIQILISQNKTTNNLRIWLSVLSENRKRHTQSQIYVIDYIIKVYGKNLLDPIDKIPSLQKSVFRITELLTKFFGDQFQNVANACQKTWIDIYQITFKDEPLQIKKKILYDNLQAIINGGGGKIAQTTAQYVVDGLLQRSLAAQDLQFFKEVAKRVLVLFLKTTVIHPSTLTCLQTILGFFNINNLIPLLQQILAKILSYIPLAQPNSTGYKIKGEVGNCLGLIAEQIDRNGLQIYEKVIKVLSDLATDKVWAVQAPGRKALQIWTSKKRQWDQLFLAKNQRIEKVGKIAPVGEQVTYMSGNQSPLMNLKQNTSQYPKTADNWMLNKGQNQFKHHQNRRNQTSFNNMYNPNKKNAQNYSVQQPNFLHKNTGPGGGNNYLSSQQNQQRLKAEQTHHRKIQQIRKSIYNSRSDIEFEDTVMLQQIQKNPKKKENISPYQQNERQNQQQQVDDDYLGKWEKILQLADKQKFEESIKILLQMDDDLYFLRFFLKYSSEILSKVTRPTSNKVLQKMLSIKKTNFMQQMLFKMVAQSAKLGIGRMLTNSQNLQISNNLENAGKISGLKQISQKLLQNYQNSLDQ